ncbi:MAG: DUF5998 family protein [Actinomycetota bacterium]|nr:DUF5998 family protein [Actinomycetota bacterium]
MRSNVAQGRSGPTADRSKDLSSAIEKTGYYPVVVSEGIRAAVADEPVLSFLVHHEPTIDRDEVRRHITVAVLTPTRLVIAHTDEHPPDSLLPEPYTASSTEAVGLSSVRSVVVNRMVANPAKLADSLVPAPTEAVLTVGWGAAARVDLEPAMCSDPNCDADHGYTGVVEPDDFSIRVSAAADGQDAVDALLAFAEVLSASTQAA